MLCASVELVSVTVRSILITISNSRPALTLTIGIALTLLPEEEGARRNKRARCRLYVMTAGTHLFPGTLFDEIRRTGAQVKRAQNRRACSGRRLFGYTSRKWPPVGRSFCFQGWRPGCARTGNWELHLEAASQYPRFLVTSNRSENPDFTATNRNVLVMFEQREGCDSTSVEAHYRARLSLRGLERVELRAGSRSVFIQEGPTRPLALRELHFASFTAPAHPDAAWQPPCSLYRKCKGLGGGTLSF